MVFPYKYFLIFFLYKQVNKKKIGKVKKFINVRLKGWKDKIDNDPIMNGKTNKVKSRFSRYLEIIYSIKERNFFSTFDIS